MTNRFQKIRMSYDELAYILSLMGVDRYIFFERQSRNIDIEQAVLIIRGMIRKKWIVPGKERYALSEELRRYVEQISCSNRVFAVRAEYNRCHDLLCYSRKDQVLSIERDHNIEEHVLLCLNDADSFTEMLDEEGYLRNIVPVNEEDRDDAQKGMAVLENMLNSKGGTLKECRKAMLSFENISENGNSEDEKPRWMLEDPFAEEDDSTDNLEKPFDRRFSGIYIFVNGTYPYISVENRLHSITIPYNKKELKTVLAGWITEII